MSTFRAESHRCDPPYEEVPADDPGWVGFWFCPECRTEWRMGCGEYGARSVDSNGNFIEWSKTAQRVSRN